MPTTAILPRSVRSAPDGLISRLLVSGGPTTSALPSFIARWYCQETMRLPGGNCRSESPTARPPRLKGVPALTRGIAVLRLLGRREEPLGVNAIARQLDLIPSTCLHILRVLVAEGLVAFDADSKRYSLDAGVLGLARGYLARPSFPALVQPGLDDLARRHGVAAIGMRVLGLQPVTVVAVSRSEAPIRLHIDVGRRFPALISATGRCVAALSGRPMMELEARFRQLRWENAPTLRDWRRQVKEASERGYGVDEGHYIGGGTSVAAPLPDAARRIT